MSGRIQVQMLFHGAIVLFVGLLCGLPFGVAVARGWSDESVRSWLLAHSGAVAVGVMLIAIGAALHRMVLGRRAASVLVWSLIGSAYGFTVALVLRGVVGVRGFQLSGPTLNVMAFVGNLLGVTGSLIGGALVVYGTYAALGGAGSGLEKK